MVFSDRVAIVVIPTSAAPNRANIQTGVISETCRRRKTAEGGGSLSRYTYHYVYDENGDVTQRTTP